MAHALAMRATSLAASAALLALALAAALSATYVIQQFTIPDTTVEMSYVPAPPPPYDPPPQAVEPPQTPLQFDAPFVDAPPLQIESTAPPAMTSLPVASGPVTIQNPHWLAQPRDLARYYPRRAVTRDVEGVVELDCLVSRVGSLSCRVLSETPANWGFADAALRIAADYRMVPATRDGVAVEGRYRMHVPFEIAR